jgi:hypothetical protein
MTPKYVIALQREVPGRPGRYADESFEFSTEELAIDAALVLTGSAYWRRIVVLAPDGAVVRNWAR